MYVTEYHPPHVHITYAMGEPTGSTLSSPSSLQLFINLCHELHGDINMYIMKGGLSLA